MYKNIIICKYPIKASFSFAFWCLSLTLGLCPAVLCCDALTAFPVGTYVQQALKGALGPPPQLILIT